jgi:transposase
VIKNTPAAITLWLAGLRERPELTPERMVFCMEQTGIYTQYLLDVLEADGVHIVLENAYHMKYSMGMVRSKTDRLDAERIARYAYKNRDELRLWTRKRPVIDQLAHLSTLRTRLVSVGAMLATPLKEQSNFINPALHERSTALSAASLAAAQADLKRTDRALYGLIKGDPKLKKLFKIITSIPGIGPTTAIHLIFSTNEFLTINEAKKFAAYAGIAPFPRESGTVIRKLQLSKMANKKIKSLLHICAIAAIRSQPEFKTYYQRKIAEGKPKMAVINALRNKLVLRVFACVHQNRLYILTPPATESPAKLQTGEPA